MHPYTLSGVGGPRWLTAGLGRCRGTEACRVAAPRHRWHLAVDYMSQVSLIVKRGNWGLILVHPAFSVSQLASRGRVTLDLGGITLKCSREAKDPPEGARIKEGSMSEEQRSDSVRLTPLWNGTRSSLIFFP